MAPLSPLTILDPYAWERSTVTRLALGDLVSAGQLVANEEGRPAEWIVPPAGDHAPNPPEGYVVSFIRFHERGFAAPASHFMRVLCHRYGVELHNFAPNAISQAATFVGVCEGYLPRGALHAAHDGAEDLPRGARRRDVARPAGAVQGRLHPLHHDDEQHRLGAGMVLPAQRRARPPRLHWSGAPGEAQFLGPRDIHAQHRRRLDSLLAALKNLATHGLTVAGVLAFLHHRRVVPLMERPLCIYEMTEEADPVALARSRMLPTP
jgi:hypothetical protein